MAGDANSFVHVGRGLTQSRHSTNRLQQEQVQNTGVALRSVKLCVKEGCQPSRKHLQCPQHIWRWGLWKPWSLANKCDCHGLGEKQTPNGSESRGEGLVNPETLKFLQLISWECTEQIITIIRVCSQKLSCRAACTRSPNSFAATYWTPAKDLEVLGACDAGKGVSDELFSCKIICKMTEN